MPARYSAVQTPVVVTRVNGLDAPDLSSRIIDLRYSDKAVGSKKRRHLVESVDITLSDPTYELDGDYRVDTDAMWEVRWGYPSAMSDVYAFRVKYYTPEFSHDAHTKKLTLLGVGHVLTEARNGKNWGKVPSSAIAREVARKHGFRAVVDESDDQASTPYVQAAGVLSLIHI